MSNPPRKWRWVTRDLPGGHCPGTVAIWASPERPKLSGSSYFQATGRAAGSACPYEFGILTGIDVQPGQCIKVEFITKILEEGETP